MGDWKVLEPTATTNLCTNPSFEKNTTGWLAGGTNTISQSADQSWVGNYSLKITYQDTQNLCRYPTTSDTFPTTSTTYKITGRVWVFNNWDGGDIAFAIGSFSDGSITTVSQYTDGTDNKREWIYLESTLTIGTDVTGNIFLNATSAPTAGRVAHLEAVQIEETSTATTYCDGDREGCWWDGTPHASTSQRLATSRAGGIKKDLEDDFGFKVQRWPGTGMTAPENISKERVVYPGAEWQRAREPSRLFVLTGTITGSTFADLESKREALVTLLSPFSYDQGAVTFIYKDKQIRGRYAGGLELDRVFFRNEQVNLPFLATEPRWMDEDLPDQSTALATGSLTTTLILGKINGTWSDLGPPNAAGTYTNIRDIKAGPDGRIYVCGDFLNFDNIANADYIAAYDPVGDSWSAVGAPSTGATITAIYKMAFAPNGDLYVVGNFTNLAGVAAADYIAKYSAAGVWGAVGTPNTGAASITDIQAVSWGWGNRLWVGGNFLNLADVAAADRIAYFNISTSTWTAAGTAGADGEVADIWAMRHIDLVFAGGKFTTIDSVSSTSAIMRVAGTWTTMANGITDDNNRLFVVSNNLVYAVGERVDANSTVAAYWQGEKWQQLGDVVDDSAYGITQTVDGEIVIGGVFTNINTVLGESTVSVDGVAYWNGNIWSPAEFNLPGSPPTVYAVEALPNGDIYFGHNKDGAATVPSSATITNSGTAPAWPVFYITQSGGASSRLLKIENYTTGKKLTFSYSLNDGIELWIDLRPRTLGMYTTAPDSAAIKAQTRGVTSMKGAGSGESIAFGGRFFRFGPDSDLATFQLVPGDNIINMFFETGSGATVTAFVRYVNSYGSGD